MVMVMNSELVSYVVEEYQDNYGTEDVFFNELTPEDLEDIVLWIKSHDWGEGARYIEERGSILLRDGLQFVKLNKLVEWAGY